MTHDNTIMSNRNIHQITDFSHLKRLVSENLTVIIGFICPSTSKSERIMVKKFLKRKSELFPLIQFVYMELTENQIETTRLDIIDQDMDVYPMIYHIRDGNKVLCEIKSADQEAIYEAFDEVAPYYKAEMEEFARSVKDKKKSKSAKSAKNAKAKKSKVVINIAKSKDRQTADNDSESEIEIDQNAGDDEMNEDYDQNNSEQTKSDQGSQKTKKVNTDKANMDPEMKAAIEREKFYAIEDAYDKIQEELFEEVKDRIRLEQKEAEEEEKKAKKAKGKSKDKSGSKGKRGKQVDRPQHDQIGPASNKQGGNVRRRRR